MIKMACMFYFDRLLRYTT